MRRFTILTLLFAGMLAIPQRSSAQVGVGSQPFLGEILAVPFNFAPTGWAMCQGQLLSITQNTALFTLIGTTFGGDGVSTFALPDLRGRSVIGAGQGPGLGSYDVGDKGGEETVTLQVSQIPAHTHSVMANSTLGNLVGPGGEVWSAQSQLLIYSSSRTTTMAPLGTAGGGQPHDNLSPYLTINYIIALNGIFPTRP